MKEIKSGPNVLILVVVEYEFVACNKKCSIYKKVLILVVVEYEFVVYLALKTKITANIVLILVVVEYEFVEMQLQCV